MAIPESSLQLQKAELIRELDECRQAIGVGADELASSLDLPRQFRASFASGRWRWLAGAMAAGLVSGIVLFSRSRRSSAPARKRSSFALGLMDTLLRGSIASMAQPLVQTLLEGRGEKWLRQILAKRQG